MEKYTASWPFQAFPGDHLSLLSSAILLGLCLTDRTCFWWEGILLSTLPAIGSRVPSVAAASLSPPAHIPPG